MNIKIRKSAIKDLKQLTNQQRQKIHKKILELKEFPQISNVKKLTQYEPAYRLRIGNYRVLFDVDDNTIIIGRVLQRKYSYKNKR